MGKSKKKDKSHKKHAKAEKKEKRRRQAEEEASVKRRRAEDKVRSKAAETPEERNSRRLAKKLAKQAKQKEEKELFGYTNEANPFNDPNLTKAFVWKKKFDKEGAAGKKQNLTKSQLKEKQVKLHHEIEKVKERRAAREIEKEQMDLMREQMEKDAIIDAVEGWEEREEEFHRNQAHQRSEIRIREGREKAIDILAKNLKLSADDDIDADIPVDLDVELTEPHQIFDGMGRRDLEELSRDLQIHLDLGTGDLYWQALVTICEDELHKHDNGGNGAYGLQADVYLEIVGLLDGKNFKELTTLEKDVNRKMKLGGQDESVDVAYWDNLLMHLQIFKAKAHLIDFHKALLKKRLKQLKRAHFDNDENEDSEAPEEEEDWEPKLIPHSAVSAAEISKVEDDSDGDFSPVLISHQDADPGALEDALDPEQDRKELEARRRVILEAKGYEEKEAKAAAIAEQQAALQNEADERTLGTKRFAMSADDMFAREEGKDMDDGEEVFKSESSTTDQTYWWHDKYRPRKPRYFNRVRTGFEWNKYNQTHYDKENPPPKIVQGYKFNVFYPDLIDQTKPPRYYLEDDGDSKDHCLIRFTAGPPYEDIAFKIVRKEWEYNHKRGFKCVFDRGVLNLNFNFRRYRYRR